MDAAQFQDDLRKSVLFTQVADTTDACVNQLNDVLAELLDTATSSTSTEADQQVAFSRGRRREACPPSP